MADATQSMNRDSNESYRVGIRGKVRYGEADDEVVTLNGYRILGMPSGDYATLRRQTKTLWERMRSSQTTARCSYQRGTCEECWCV